MTADWWTRRDAWELRLQRVALALLVYAAFDAEPRYLGQPYPVGIAAWIDFSFLGDRTAAVWAELALIVALACYVAGRAMPLAVAVMAFLYIGAGALAYSQGMLEHHTQLLGMVLLAQLLAYVQAGLRPSATANRHALATHYSVEVIAAAYVLAGLMKIVLSRGQWLAQAPMIVTDIAKAHGQEFCSSGDLAWLTRADFIAGLILAHPYLTRALLAPAIVFELGAAAAVLGRTSAMIVGLGLFAMHRGIDAMMAIRFPENEALVLIYFVNAPYLLVRLWRAVTLRVSSS